MNPHLLSKSNLRDIPKTVHGGQAWRLKDVEDYSHNLNPFGPPEDIKEIIDSSISGIDHYPDDDCAELKDVISKRFSVPRDSVIIGSGSSDIIRMFPNTFIDSGEKAVISVPSFAEYSHQCRVAGCDIVWNDLPREDGFRIDYDKLKQRAKGAKAVYICNPNNPTGMIERRKDILSFVDHCASEGTMVFLDETLLELVPGYKDITCSGYVSRYQNLVVACSLTKSFAIPGIRIGFGFADPALIDEMNKVRMTWNVGTMEQNVAKVLIRDRMDHVEKAAELMASESRWMYSQLEDIGFPIVDSDSYFYFNPLDGIGMDAKEFVSRMLKSSIMVRDCSSFGPSFTSFVRFCVKDRKRNERFVKAVEDAMR